MNGNYQAGLAFPQIHGNDDNAATKDVHALLSTPTLTAKNGSTEHKKGGPKAAR